MYLSRLAGERYRLCRRESPVLVGEVHCTSTGREAKEALQSKVHTTWLALQSIVEQPCDDSSSDDGLARKNHGDVEDDYVLVGGSVWLKLNLAVVLSILADRR